jgi:phosphoribosylformylglycinamidine synthase
VTLGIVTFPGSNCDHDVYHVAKHVLGAEAHYVWHKDRLPAGLDAVILPGGFSYGDYLRCGAIARFSPVMRAVERFAADGGPVLGICNGFQILCEAALLPGALRPNASLGFLCRDVRVVVERAAPPFTLRCSVGERLTIPVKHGEGSWYAPAELLAELERDNRIVLRYEAGANPNGSVGSVAGVVDAGGNVMGLMPHPEHAVDTLRGSADGALILGSLVDAARLRMRFPSTRPPVRGLPQARDALRAPHAGA